MYEKSWLGRQCCKELSVGQSDPTQQLKQHEEVDSPDQHWVTGCSSSWRLEMNVEGGLLVGTEDEEGRRGLD